MFGVPAEEIVGRPIAEVMGRDAFETIRPYVERVLLGEKVEYEAEIPYQGIGTRVKQVTYVPERNETDEVIGWISSVVDITQRRHAEEALRLKEAEPEAIINLTPFMLTRCTRDLRYRYTSRAYAHMLGREPEDIAGKPIVDIMGQPGLQSIMPHVQRVLRGEQAEYEAEIFFENVGTKSLRVVYTPDRDERGDVIGWIGSIADVSDRKRVEAERERLLKNEYELRQVAEEANRLKDEFLAIMSHQLRNALNVIPGYSELLVRSENISDPKQVRRMAETIRRNAVAQAKLISDLLDLSRLRSGKLELSRDTVSVMTSINNAIDMVRSDAQAKEIRSM